jgi:tellurite resistance protein
MSEALILARSGRPVLEYLPVGLFGSVMGLTGLSIAFRLAHEVFGTPMLVATAIGGLAMATFVGVAVAYTMKLVTAFDAVRTEFRHPIAGSLFGTILISLLLLPIVLAPLGLGFARGVWGVGAILMVGFAWLIVSRWMSDRQMTAHATPAWFIPVVGMLDVPLALPALGLGQWRWVIVTGLAIGLFFAVPLFTMVFSRLLFEPPLPDALQPSLLILVAPFAVGFSTYSLASGRIDVFAQTLYVLTLFLFAVLIGRLGRLAACCPFRVAWWAVSFPLAACAIAALRMALAEPSWGVRAVAAGLLALATAVIAGLAVRTLVGVMRGELRTLSG